MSGAVDLQPSPAYERFGVMYEAFLGDLSRDTWQLGIVADLVGLGLSAGRVLDVAAGTGVGASEITRQTGLEVTCVDRSAGMLDIAARSYRVVLADMRDFAGACPDAGGYDAVVSGFDSVNYLDLAGLAGFLASSAACVRPGGYVIFDYSSQKFLQQDWRDTGYDQESDGFVLSWRNSFDDELQRCTMELCLTDRGGQVVWREVHHQYSFDPYLIARLATRHGLDVTRIRDLERPTFSPLNNTHVYQLRRPEPGE